jgi:hypothetical protein
VPHAWLIALFSNNKPKTHHFLKIRRDAIRSARPVGKVLSKKPVQGDKKGLDFTTDR